MAEEIVSLLGNASHSAVAQGLGGMKQRMKSRLQLREMLDNPLVTFGAGVTMLSAAAMTNDLDRKLGRLIRAVRHLENPLLQPLGKRAVSRWLAPETVDIWRDRKIGWNRYYGGIADISRDRTLATSLVLKEPGENGEKGVLYSSFEYNWMKIIANHDARRFLDDYFLVGASSSSPTDYAAIASLCGLSQDPVFIGMSNHDDLAQYRFFEPHIHPLPILACDWVDPGDFSPKPHGERSIDILMVSHTDYLKRHRLLFNALKTMRRDLNVVLIGRVGKRSAQDLMDEARAFGVKQDVTFLSHLEFDEVAQYQCNARVNLALSKREGSCVAVTEALFADSPVGVMRDAHMGSKAYINDHTGKVFDVATMSKALSEMIETSGEFRAREWACNNISAQISSSKLNEALRHYSLSAGLPWTRDITPMCWRYVPRYLDPEAAGDPGAGLARLRDEHGIELEEFVSEKSARARKIRPGYLRK